MIRSQIYLFGFGFGACGRQRSSLPCRWKSNALSPDEAQQHRYDGKYQQHMDDTAKAEYEKAKCPTHQKDYHDKI